MDLTRLAQDGDFNFVETDVPALWLMTFLPVATGLLAAAHLGLPYETLLTLHILSLCAFFIWFPFGKLMHAFLFVLSRGMTGIRLGQRGAAL